MGIAPGAARIARDADELDPGLVEENAIGDEARYGRLSIGVLEPAVHGRCSAGEGVAGILDGNGNGKAKPPRWQGSNGKRSGGNGSAGSLPPVRKSAAMRTRLTRQEFLSRSDAPLVWRNLFFPPEILNALGVRMLTMETYAALRARNGK